MRLRRFGVSGQGFFGGAFCAFSVRDVIKSNAEVGLRELQVGNQRQCALELFSGVFRFVLFQQGDADIVSTVSSLVLVRDGLF